jgi:hypothetical protein
MVFDEAQHGKVVGQGAGSRDHFNKFWSEGLDAPGCRFQPLGAREVVKADQQRRAGLSQTGAEVLQLRRFGLLGRLDFKVGDAAAGLGGFDE